MIDIDAVPLACASLQRPGFPESALLLDIGARDTTAVFAGKGQDPPHPPFPFGGETVTGAMPEALRIDSTEAEAMKQSGELPEAAGAAIREVRDRFSRELKNTQAYLLWQGSLAQAPARIILTGGGSRTPGTRRGVSRSLFRLRRAGGPVATRRHSRSTRPSGSRGIRRSWIRPSPWRPGRWPRGAASISGSGRPRRGRVTGSSADV